MKKYLPKKTPGRLGFFLCLSLLQLNAFAQQKPSLFSDSLFTKLADTTVRPFVESAPFFIAIWNDAHPKNVDIIRRLDEKTAIIKVRTESELRKLETRARIAPAMHNWKLSPAAGKVMDKFRSGHQKYLVTTVDLDSLVEVLKKMTNSLSILSVDKLSNTVVVSSTAKFVNDHLLPLKEIIFVDVRENPHSEINIIGYNRSFHGINAVDYSFPNANGKNVVVGVKEQTMDQADIDLYKRVLPSPLAAPGRTNHATVISSIIGGAGNSFYSGRGIAYGCRFFPSSFENLFADDPSVLNSNKVTVQNHSYGTVIQQFYGTEAVSYDNLSWNNKNYVPVFSAGNQGMSFSTEGKYANIAGYANLTGNFKMAKNVITVGAVDNESLIAGESSAGPLYDGRLAPQLVALGPNGTSDAAAIVSGTIAVMQQVYADHNNQALPEASLIRAILYNNAEDIHSKGIDYKTGYGMLDSYASIQAIQRNDFDSGFLSAGEQWTRTISIPLNAAQLKVTLAWTDSAAHVNDVKAIVNDLDLEVQEVNSGIIYKPWVLNSASNPDSLSKPAIRRRDSLNTAEQVSIPLPATGNYQVKVIGADISSPAISFHMSWRVDTLNTFQFTSPQHASDVNRDEDASIFIRWKTFVADTNQTGNLYISYDRGASWSLLLAGYKIYNNRCKWEVKDTNSTAVLKMETGFGEFLSKEFIIGKVTRPRMDFNCADSFGISWSKHVYASNYKLFALTDSPYLKHILTIQDTSVVFRRSDFPWLVYAVEPILTNKIAAARSIAFDITQQGVNCFYKTFYYNLLDQNKLELVLELSEPAYTDSIYWQQLTETGQVLQAFGAMKVAGPAFIYQQLIDNVASGTTYWRASITLKNGALVYTDKIAVVTSGKNYILFFPNPVLRSGVLTYVLQQGVLTSSRLQLFDISGRLLKEFSEMPGSIDVSSMQAGIVIFKLIGADGKVLQRGKLMIL